MLGTGEGERIRPATAEGVTPVIAQDPEPYRASDSGETGPPFEADPGAEGAWDSSPSQNSQAKGQRGAACGMHDLTPAPDLP